MNEAFVTVATFWKPIEAHLAQVHLQSAGIESVLQNENSISMNWLEFANISKGVQLQVRASNVDRAREVLSRKGESEDSVAVDEDPAPAEWENEPPDPPELPLNEREQLAERAWKAAVFGIIFWPLEFYATYQLGLVLLRSSELRRSVRQRLNYAIALNSLMIGGMIVVAIIIRSFSAY
jgi:hypothetical protein